MNELIEFAKQNIVEISIISLIIIFLLVVINIKGINLNQPIPEPKLIQQVTVESFVPEENVDKLLSKSDNFCDSYSGNGELLEKACNELTKDNCANIGCCVYIPSVDTGKCVAGDANGPTYKTDKDGKLITADSYYYLGKQMK